MKLYNDKDILIRQGRMGMGFFAVWLMLIITIQWMTLDMYLPALPILKTEFGISEALLNVSVNAGIITTAIGNLIGGTMSDRFGRKKMMIAGLLVCAAGCFMCALARGIILLTAMRGVTGLGSGFALSIVTAMAKDSYSGESFRNITTLMQSVAVIGPIIAPISGSILINYLSWRYIFIFLGLATFATAVPMFISTETWPQAGRVGGGLAQMLAESGRVVRDPGFVAFLGVMAFLTIPIWAYIAVSSYVYIEEFGRSNMEYGLFYAVGAIMSFAAPFLYLYVNRRHGTKLTVWMAIALVFAGAVIMLSAGGISPFIFVCGVVALMLSEGVIRPLGVVVLMERHADTAGTSSSVIQFICNIVGIIGTSLATLAWSSQVIGVGVVSAVCGVLSVLCWVAILRRDMISF